MRNEARLTYLGLLSYAVLSLGSMATMSVGVGLFALGFLVDGIRSRSLKAELREVWAFGPARALSLAAAGLSLALLVSLLGAEFFPFVIGGMEPEVRWPADLGKCWYLFFPLVWATAWKRLDDTQRAKVIRAWLWAFAALSLVGVQQLFTGWPRAQANPNLPSYFHPTLFIGHHLSVASIWIFPFFAALDYLLRKQRPDAAPRPAFWLGVGVLAGLFTLFFGYSRTLWVALPAMLLAFSLIRLPGRLKLAPIVVLLAGAAIAWQFTTVQRRIIDGGGVAARQDMWMIHAEFFRERPIFGVGFGKNSDLTYGWYKAHRPEIASESFVSHAHNLPLEILAGTGVFGAVAWLFWFGTVFSFAWSSWKARDVLPDAFALGLLCAWGALLINSLTQVNFWEGKVLHQIVWMAGLSLFWRWKLAKVRVSTT